MLIYLSSKNFLYLSGCFYRAMSTVHAVFITVMSLYLVFWSDLYSDDRLAGPVTLRNSPMSTFVLGVRTSKVLLSFDFVF